MNDEEYVITVKLRWWVVPYLQTLAFVAFLTGATPDRDKAIGRVMLSGFKVELRCGPTVYRWNGTTTGTATRITKGRA